MMKKYKEIIWKSY